MDQVSILVLAENLDCLSAVVRMVNGRYHNARVDGASDPVQAAALLKKIGHEIVLCDLYVDAKENPSIIAEFCGIDGKKRVVIAATADTSMTLETILQYECVQSVLHKPIDMKILFHEVDTAIVRVLEWRENNVA